MPISRPYRFNIVVANEGQEFYTETFIVTTSNKVNAVEAATIRENQIISGLMKLLPDGSWDADAELT